MPYPDGPSRNFAQQFSNFGSEASTGFAAYAFGFAASVVKIVSDGTGSAYVAFNTTGAITTGTANLYRLTTGDGVQTFHNVGGGISGLAYSASSTAGSVRFVALGG